MYLLEWRFFCTRYFINFRFFCFLFLCLFLLQSTCEYFARLPFTWPRVPLLYIHIPFPWIDYGLPLCLYFNSSIYFLISTSSFIHIFKEDLAIFTSIFRSILLRKVFTILGTFRIVFVVQACRFCYMSSISLGLGFCQPSWIFFNLMQLVVYWLKLLVSIVTCAFSPTDYNYIFILLMVQ